MSIAIGEDRDIIIRDAFEFSAKHNCIVCIGRQQGSGRLWYALEYPTITNGLEDICYILPYGEVTKLS